MIAFLDVSYRDGGGRAACILAHSWTDLAPAATFVADIPTVEPYIPGSFYRRELPCLLAVLALLPEPPDTLVVDGYVWLGPNGRQGLGARLHEAAGGTPVVGVAKTKFRTAEPCDWLRLVTRGHAATPLYVTAVAMDADDVAAAVATMAGAHRIPDLLRAVDRLSRAGDPSV